MRKTLLALGFVASASAAMAQFTPVTSVGVIQEAAGTGYNLWLQSITAGGNTYAKDILATGTTTANPNLSFPTVDDWNLSTLQPNIGNQPAAGASVPVKTVLFGGNNWKDSNGTGLDFFIFEVGTGDPMSLFAIFPDGSAGALVNRPTSGSVWGNIGYTSTITQTGQNIVGMGFSITDLLDASGSPLTTSSEIKGIGITLGTGQTGVGLDEAGLFAVVPVPEPSTMALALLGLGALALARKRC